MWKEKSFVLSFFLIVLINLLNSFERFKNFDSEKIVGFLEECYWLELLVRSSQRVDVPMLHRC